MQLQKIIITENDLKSKISAAKLIAEFLYNFIAASKQSGNIYLDFQDIEQAAKLKNEIPIQGQIQSLNRIDENSPFITGAKEAVKIAYEALAEIKQLAGFMFENLNEVQQVAKFPLNNLCIREQIIMGKQN